MAIQMATQWTSQRASCRVDDYQPLLVAKCFVSVLESESVLAAKVEQQTRMSNEKVKKKITTKTKICKCIALLDNFASKSSRLSKREFYF